MKHCPKYRSTEAIKSGTMLGKQRYKCKTCGCHYTQSRLGRVALERKLYALKLYLEANGFRGIERLTGIDHTTVIKWVKTLAVAIEKLRPEISEQVMTVGTR